MSTDELLAENKRLKLVALKNEKVKALLVEWKNKQGHDGCWYYPELFRQMAAVLEVDVALTPTISRQEFMGGCNRFQDEVYGK